MAKDKDRQLNPAAAQRKADKAKALKKSKAQVATQRNEKLARRNPERLQRQIDDLKAAETNGSLRPKDRQTLEQLEKDVKAILKARETLGDKVPQFGRESTRDGSFRGSDRGGFRGRGGGRGGILGKRRRYDDEQSSDTDEDVKEIPMPKDVENMPPIPRRNRPGRGAGPSSNASAPHPLPPRPSAAAAQTVYESAPMIRDLRKEAVSRFVPSAVQAKIKAVKGEGRLLEPEEAEKLEQEGYRDAEKATTEALKEAQFRMMNVDGAKVDLDEEERRFERELRQVEIEDVEDEDD